MKHTFLLSFAPLLFACASSGGDDGAGNLGSSVEIVAETPTSADLAQGVAPEFVPALETVIAALDDGNESIARAALARLMARRPTGKAMDIALGLERILDGREHAAGLELVLEAVEQEEVNGRYTLSLLGRYPGETELVLRPGGARLTESLMMIDPRGGEQRGSRRQGIPFPEEVRFPPDEEVRLPLAEIQLPAPSGLLAVSSRLHLELLPGEFVDPEGRYLPAQSVRVEPVELVRLASFLPTAAVEPVELAKYVGAGRIFVPAMLERAVRILPERRAEALDLLAPRVESMSLVDLELLVPALRWLTRTDVPGGNPEAWRVWMRDRGERRSASKPDWEGLELPGT